MRDSVKMLSCYVCKKQFTAVKELTYHITKLCKNYSLSRLGYRCGEMGCYRSYFSANSFRKHLRLCHSTSKETRIGDLQSISVLDTEGPSTSMIISQCGPATSSENSQSINLHASNDEMLLNGTSLFVASLYSNPLIPRSTTQAFLNGLQSFLNMSSRALQHKFYSLVSREDVSPDIDAAFNVVLSSLTQSFSPFNSEFKCLKQFRLMGCYIPPREVIIGYRADTSTRSNVFNIVSKPCGTQLIPLRAVLKKIFSIETVWTETVGYVNQLTNAMKSRREFPSSPTCIENIIQGSLAKIQSIKPRFSSKQ